MGLPGRDPAQQDPGTVFLRADDRRPRRPDLRLGCRQGRRPGPRDRRRRLPRAPIRVAQRRARSFPARRARVLHASSRDRPQLALRAPAGSRRGTRTAGARAVPGLQPRLRAERVNLTIAEASLVTARLRPNPVFSFSGDHLDLLGTGFSSANNGGPPEIAWRVDVPLERGHKRALRVETAGFAREMAEARLGDA